MKNAAFKTRLAQVDAGGLPPARSPEDELFVTYNHLPAHGIPAWTRVHLRRLMSQGLFPRPVMLSPNRIAWRLSDLGAWKASRPTAPVATAPSEAA